MDARHLIAVEKWTLGLAAAIRHALRANEGETHG